MVSAPTVSPTSETATRPIASGSWKATFAGGVFKLLIAALAFSLPLVEARPLPLWVGGMLLAGGLAELTVGWTARHSVVGKVALGSGTMTRSDRTVLYWRPRNGAGSINPPNDSVVGGARPNLWPPRAAVAFKPSRPGPAVGSGRD